MPSDWLELSLEAGTEIQDPVVNFLVDRGSTGFVHDDRILRAFFPSTEKDPELKRAVRSYLRQLRDIVPVCSVGRARWRVIADKNWNQAWRRYFKPQKIGRRLLVTPPWIAPPAKVDRQVIVIEPAMAFGTGTHETTRSCLEFIDELCREGVPPAALDLGTGSGILAIAMAKLGIRDVLALDNDPMALAAAESNVEINEVKDIVTLSGVELSRVHRRFPLVVANIILETLVRMSAPLARVVGAHGALVMSGLLAAQVESVLQHFGRFTVERRKDRKEWSTLLLRKV